VGNIHRDGEFGWLGLHPAPLGPLMESCREEKEELCCEGRRAGELGRRREEWSKPSKQHIPFNSLCHQKREEWHGRYQMPQQSIGSGQYSKGE